MVEEGEIRSLLDVKRYEESIESEKIDLEQLRTRWYGNNKRAPAVRVLY